MKKTFSIILALVILGVGAYYQHTKSPTQTTSTSSYEKVIYIPSDRYPETAEHVKEAEKKGESSICTIDRKEVKEHRKESLAGIETKPGYDRDEFPMAMCAEGGQGADVKMVHSSDNRGEGSWVSHQLSGLPDGTKVLIKVK
jgi:glutamyl/glutaminyl-tRNA synthetase